MAENIQGLSVPQLFVFYYLFTDGSPQWRGMELLVSTVDIMCGAYYRRLLLPNISIGRDSLDVNGKTSALFWQI